MRKEFELTIIQFDRLIKASQPTRVMKIGNYIPSSPQENANHAWQSLANELGFIWDSVQAIPGKSDHFFSAEIKET